MAGKFSGGYVTGSPGASDSLAEGVVTAVLGPTNTGKTHLAVERMLGHSSGMIGLPLRLLAREIYDRIVRLRGAASVALITGEEKIIPAHPSYYVCTVESMPVGIPVEFLAVDEIQLCGDPDRGHIFTSRLLHARGRRETMFLGADTIAPMIRRLVRDVDFQTRSRFSRLSWAGSKKISRLPRRSAIVTFSAEDVYAIAELIRRQNGGAAVVLGALSPRTRNAQVELYQAGEVDFLVATDAIGMGLNMDVDHVAFASLNKFDGRMRRPLTAAEIGQIAGRAGRYMNDGTFGVTAGAETLEPSVIEQVQEHRFDALRAVYWRNGALDYSNPRSLIRSLEQPSERDGLVRGGDATDLIALKALVQMADIADRCQGPAAVKQLWQLCQLPDFRKNMNDSHIALLAQITRLIQSNDNGLPTDWLAAQIMPLDKVDGDVDTLSSRIANIRTWTYVANRNDWIADNAHWLGVTRTIEDKLSDALHERLTQRFVDRRTSVLLRRLREAEDLVAETTEDGEVLVEGQFVGRLEGLHFTLDPRAKGRAGKAARRAADQALRPEMAARVSQLEVAPDSEIELRMGHGGEPGGEVASEAGGEVPPEATESEESGGADAAGEQTSLKWPSLWWRGGLLAQLIPNDKPSPDVNGDILSPRVTPVSNDALTPEQMKLVGLRVNRWAESYFRGHLGPLFALRDACSKQPDQNRSGQDKSSQDKSGQSKPDQSNPGKGQLEGSARGLAYQLVEGLGSVSREATSGLIKGLEPEQRNLLRRMGVRFSELDIYLPSLLKPAPVAARLLLWTLAGNIVDADDATAFPTVPPPGLVSIPLRQSGQPMLNRDYYRVVGFNPGREVAVRMDMLDRLATMVRERQKKGVIEQDADLMSLVGCSGSDFADIMAIIGYRVRKSADKVADNIAGKVAEKTPAPETPQSDEAAVSETAATPELAEASETPEIIVFEFVRRRQHKPAIKKQQSGVAKEGQKADPAKAGKRRRASAKPAKKPPEKPLDPDSPFAALKDLRAKMGDS